jgi:hypothetical protein
MRRLIMLVAVLAIVGASFTSASALTDAQKCDKVKSIAAGKFFATAMKCLTKSFGTLFDSSTCVAAAEVSCIASFNKADTAFGGECLNVGNGPSVCAETEQAARDIYGRI